MSQEETKKYWKDKLSNTYVSMYGTVLIAGKKKRVSDFYLHAPEQLKQDKELNILNFLKSGHVYEIPEHMIDLDFLKEIFKKKITIKIFDLPYTFKNTPGEKEYLLHILTDLKTISQQYYLHNVAWSFEQGFWEDLKYTKEIYSFQVADLEKEIVQHWNKSKKLEDKETLIHEIIKIPYMLKFVSSRIKNNLPEKVILEYIQDYGLAALTQQQKDNINYIKTAFHAHKIMFKDIEEKHKSKENLLLLFNEPTIWNHSINNKQIIKLEEIKPEYFHDTDIVKIIIENYGLNLIKLKELGYEDIFENKEYKKLALKTYPTYEIIEGYLDDKELVLLLLKGINKRAISEARLLKEVKDISPELWQDKEILKEYFAILGKNRAINAASYNQNAMKELNNSNVETIIQAIGYNSRLYPMLEKHWQINWEVVEQQLKICKLNAYFNIASHMHPEIAKELNESKENAENYIKTMALKTKIERQTKEENKTVQKLKI